MSVTTGVTLSSEQEAVDRFLSSPDEESFRALFRSVAPRVICYFRARGCQHELAEDLTQEVMLSVYNQSHTLRKPEMFRLWLFQIMKNALLQHLRRSGRQIATVTLDGEFEESSGLTADPLAESRFAEWMAILEAGERQVMILRYLEQFEYHEIAEALDLPLGTVQWKIFRAKRRLAERFKEGK